LKAKEKALAIARIADENKASDIRILDVGRLCNFTDIFVIATCASAPQLRAVGHKIERRMREAGDRAISAVGYETTSWVVADFGDVVVHLFSPEAREYYRLDRLWRDGKGIELPQGE